jgi:hypothetical protein
MKRLVVILLAVLAASADAQITRRTHILTTATNDTTATGMADSSSIIGTSGYQQMFLTIKPDRPCRVAIQVRKHGLADTTAGSVALADSNNASVWSWRDLDQASSGTDSVYIRRLTIAGSAVVASDELVLNFPDEQAGNAKWGSPRALYFGVNNNNAESYKARRTSIRWRVLSGATGVVTFRNSLEGVTFP